MRKLLIAAMVTLVLSSPVVRMSARQRSSPVMSEKRMLKVRQKQEWNTLKRQQKYQKRSMRGQRLSRATRAQMKHQMQRDRRALREKHRNERQDLKDRRRLMKERTRQVY